MAALITAILPFALLAVLCLPWIVLLRQRFGLMIAVLCMVSAVPLLILATFTLSSALTLDPVLSTGIGAAALSAVGLAQTIRTSAAMPRPARTTVALWLGSSLGGVLWLAVLASAHIAPGAAPLSWAMRGDSANHIHLTREILANHGFVLGSGNPVPLQNELLAIATWIGRPDAPAGTLLLHDITALAGLWALAIAVTCTMIGLVVASALPRGRALTIGVAGGLGSLLGTTWFVSGLPIDSGYLNVHVALPFALASWLAFLQSPRHPALSTGLLLGLGLILLTTWSPLVVFPVALIGTIAVRSRSRALRPRAGIAIPLAAGFVVFAAALLALYLPAFTAGLSTLRLPGHGYPQTLGILLALLAVLAVTLVLLRRVVPLELRHGVTALAVAALGGIALLALIARDDTSPLATYYPTKLSWLATVVVGAVALSLVLVLVDHLGVRAVGVAITGAAVLLLSTIGPAPEREAFEVEQPLDTIISGSLWTGGRASLNRIVENLNSDDLVVLWESGDPGESFINFWVWDFSGAAARGGDNAVRYVSVAGYRELRDTGENAPQAGIDFLCALPDALNRSVVLVTSSPTLAGEIAARCSEQPIRVLASE